MKNLMNKIRKANKGFTLVELIIVVAVIAVLTAVVAPQYIKYVERSRQGVDAATLEEVRHAVEIEAAILETNAATSVKVEADGDVSTAASGGFASITNVTDVVGTKVALKSKAAKTQDWVIDVATTGKVTWSTTNGCDADILLLQKGTMPSGS